MLEPFVSHPRSVGQSYGAHLLTAFGFGGRLLAAGALCLAHGLAPFLFKHSASRTIHDLHARLSARRPG